MRNQFEIIGVSLICYTLQLYFYRLHLIVIEVILRVLQTAHVFFYFRKFRNFVKLLLQFLFVLSITISA